MADDDDDVDLLTALGLDVSGVADDAPPDVVIPLPPRVCVAVRDADADVVWATMDVGSRAVEAGAEAQAGAHPRQGEAQGGEGEHAPEARPATGARKRARDALPDDYGFT